MQDIKCFAENGKFDQTSKFLTKSLKNVYNQFLFYKKSEIWPKIRMLKNQHLARNEYMAKQNKFNRKLKFFYFWQNLLSQKN